MNFVVLITAAFQIVGYAMGWQIVMMHQMRGIVVCITYTCLSTFMLFHWSDTIPCKANEFTCGSTGVKYCIPQAWTCDGQDDCGNGNDERAEICMYILSTLDSFYMLNRLKVQILQFA